LRIKLFDAEDGKYQDELKQIANKFPPVPIGIKYRGVDPISSKNLLNYFLEINYEKTVYRKDLSKIPYKSIDDIKGDNSKYLFVKIIRKQKIYLKLMKNFKFNKLLILQIKSPFSMLKKNFFLM